MANGKKERLNDKTLSRKETIKLAQTKGIFHQQYSEMLTDRLDGKIVTRYNVYSLPEDRILYVRDADGKHGGKGDIYTKEYFDDFVNYIERTKEDIGNGIGNNISHWNFYSINKSKLIEKIPDLLMELFYILDDKEQKLDFSTKSLDILSDKIRAFDKQTVLITMYDNLVVYIGEVIKRNSKNATDWKMDNDFQFPFISTNYDNVNLNPINIVWGEITSMDEIDFRKGYGNELRHV